MTNAATSFSVRRRPCQVGRSERASSMIYSYPEPSRESTAKCGVRSHAKALVSRDEPYAGVSPAQGPRKGRRLIQIDRRPASLSCRPRESRTSMKSPDGPPRRRTSEVDTPLSRKGSAAPVDPHDLDRLRDALDRHLAGLRHRKAFRDRVPAGHDLVRLGQTSDPRRLVDTPPPVPAARLARGGGVHPNSQPRCKPMLAAVIRQLPLDRDGAVESR